MHNLLPGFGVVSLFCGISTFMGYVIPNSYLQRNSWEEDRFYAFPKGISPKENMIGTHLDVTVQYVSPCATETPSFYLYHVTQYILSHVIWRMLYSSASQNIWCAILVGYFSNVLWADTIFVLREVSMV